MEKVWCFGEVVAYDRWSHMEFQLYYDFARSFEIIGFARSSVICL